MKLNYFGTDEPDIEIVAFEPLMVAAETRELFESKESVVVQLPKTAIKVSLSTGLILSTLEFEVELNPQVVLNGDLAPVHVIKAISDTPETFEALALLIKCNACSALAAAGMQVECDHGQD